MSGKGQKGYSEPSRRLVLIADDEIINRDILGVVLTPEYEVMYAADGQETLNCIELYQEKLSLVLLDLNMPKVSGMEILRRMKEHPQLQKIPVIVVTADQKSEVESLGEGAVDFIPKPFPQADVIRARIHRTIELYEDRDIIIHTERDPLTGLYNREYFYRHAVLFDQRHKRTETDAIILDVNHFHMINERFGTEYGDEVLRRIGTAIRSAVRDFGGMVCRREADSFMVYCPHVEDYKGLLGQISSGLVSEDKEGAIVRLRMGVYANTDKLMDIERRFDRAKMAADTVRGSFARTIGMYDSALHEKKLYAERLIDDFGRAIEGKQFVVFFQPKFDIRPETPILASAEALVRWKHPELGMISPGVFIPLFEENGLIQRLDQYIWRETARQIRQWRERFGFTVPVSVNVSRIDIYDPELIQTFRSIIEDNGLTAGDLHLEITESAYTRDSEQMIETVNRLRELGFCIEMDDFGTGYSSLNMISTIPIDALKLDMQFIRNAFSKGKDTRMLEVILDIADYLSVPVIAEGVETQEQLDELKKMGCDMVQGYYFSRPVPAEEYERFLLQRIEQGDEKPVESKAERTAQPQLPQAERQEQATDSPIRGYEQVFYVDTQNDHYLNFSAKEDQAGLQVHSGGEDFFGEMVQTLAEGVCEEERNRFVLCLNKGALLTQLSSAAPYTITFRQQGNCGPVRYALKAARAMGEEDRHIFVGVARLDAQQTEGSVVDEENSRETAYSHIAQALAQDYFSIYYVDTRTDRFIEYSAFEDYAQLGIEKGGEDFFNLSRRNVLRVMHKDDLEPFLRAFTKENILQTLENSRSFSLIYRLIFDGRPNYVSMKATRLEGGDSHHIVIGVSNINDQMHRQEEFEKVKAKELTFARIAEALAEDYFSIYYVDLKTDRFIEYSAHTDYDSLQIEKSGKDFFNLSRKNILRVMYYADQAQFLETFTKENLLRMLDQEKTFTLTYRLLFDGQPTYVSMKATRMKDDEGEHLIIGVNNIDAQMRREQEYTRDRVGAAEQ